MLRFPFYCKDSIIDYANGLSIQIGKSKQHTVLIFIYSFIVVYDICHFTNIRRIINYLKMISIKPKGNKIPIRWDSIALVGIDMRSIKRKSNIFFRFFSN